jgi:hypothetical protein
MIVFVMMTLIFFSEEAYSQAPAPGPYYFVTDDVGGNPQFYWGDPFSGTYAGILTVENYNLLATVVGDNPLSLLGSGQTLVPPQVFSFPGGSVTLQPFAYTVSGSNKKRNLPLGLALRNFLNDPLNGAKFDLSLPFSNHNVALSNQSAHLRIDNRPNAVHTSVDFDLTGNSNQGFSVLAAREGIVIGNSGGAFVIKHAASNGKEFLSIYQHLDPASKAHWTLNSPIARGALIGRVDDRDAQGNPKYAHLHFAVAVKGPARFNCKGPRQGPPLSTNCVVVVPEMWYLIDPFGVYDYRRNSGSTTLYNYLPNNTLSFNVRGIMNAYVFRTNPPVFSIFPGELAVGQTVRMNISAQEPYNLTGIYFRDGQKFQFTTASPEWNNGGTETNCDGYSSLNPFDLTRRHNDYNMMALVGEIFQQNNNSSYTGTYFKIGCGPKTYTAPRNGYLVVFANDVLVAYGDNSRVVTLMVTRTQ